MVGLVNTKDFYVDSHYLCGVRSPENIFDLPESIFECGDVFCFEHAIKKYVGSYPVTMHLWPWLWSSSELTDEVYIYEIENNRIIYLTSTMNEFFDAKLIRHEECLQGCEIFDYDFKFPKML
jgi:hypothetical protein